jgi:hypothetical protein
MLRLIAAAALAALACGCSKESSQDPREMRAPTAAVEEPPELAKPLDPVAQVSAIYAPYLAGTAPPPILDVAPWMGDLRARLLEATSKEQPILTIDPIVGAKEADVSNLVVTLGAPPEAGRARVVAKFQDGATERAVNFDMVRIGDSWLVDNVRSGDWDLRQTLVEGIAASK